MSESLKEVIARIKAKQQNSQQSNKVIEKPIEKKEIEVPTPDEDEDLSDLDEEIPKEEEKQAVKPQKEVIEASKEEISREQQIMMEIEMLQNNGRYRVEMLHQLQEINRALVVIAGVLVDLSGNDKKE